ncbi:MAG TPA: BamA/TamA family outer membrane protein [Kofleriaceae bacterium]|nr:BamA/TamA family outer membrane protein [Kofleriaceae bacterium]
MARLWICVLVVMCAGCSGKRRVEHPNQVWLSEIKIEGNHAIEDDDLIPGLALERARRDGRGTDPYQLTVDTKRIRGAYLRLGFFDVQVDARIDREDNAEIVVFTVVEGPRLKAAVSITGLPPEVSEAAVRGKLGIKDGQPFDYGLYEDGKDIVKAMVEEAGYPYLDLDDSVVTVDKPKGVAAASYRVTLLGPRAAFGDVTITGVDAGGDLERAIRGRLMFRTGEPYSPKALVETQRALYDLQRFSQVRIEPDRTGLGATVPITIGVTVVSRHELHSGGGFGYDAQNYEARVRGGFWYVPLDYPLWTLSSDARVAASFPSVDDLQWRIRVIGSAHRHEMFRPYLQGQVDVGIDYFALDAYTAAGPIVRLFASGPLGVRWLTGQLGWAFSYFDFSDIDPAIDPVTAAKLGLRGQERNGRFEQSIAAERRDNPLDPRRGFYIGVRVSEGTYIAGGAFDYLEIQPDLRFYIPIRSLVLAGRARGGTILGDVPVTERFFMGGAQSHRGFAPRTLSPSITAIVDGEEHSVRIGGETFLETGLELRIPIGDIGVKYGLTLFLDGGDVPADTDKLDLTNLHWAAGAGVYIKLGGFKIRVDVGHRLNRTGPGEPYYDPDPLIDFLENTSFSLGVGETF